MSQVIQLPLQRSAAELRADTFDETDFTLDMCFTTGSTGRRVSWSEGEYDEELVVSANAVRLARLNAGAPLLNTHAQWDLSAVIGSVVPGSARLANGVGLAKVQLSRAPGDADVVQKIRDKIIRNTSVGYIRHLIEKTERAGQVPLWRVVDWEPYELSAVPIGFDPGAQFRSAPGGASLHPCTIVNSGLVHAARARMRMRAAAFA